MGGRRLDYGPRFRGVGPQLPTDEVPPEVSWARSQRAVPEFRSVARETLALVDAGHLDTADAHGELDEAWHRARETMGLVVDRDRRQRLIDELDLEHARVTGELKEGAVESKELPPVPHPMGDHALPTRGVPSPARRLGPEFTDAIAYAVELHAGQTRKGGDLPYISHLLAVCALVLEDGGTEEEAIAALLHDAAEDQGGEPRLEAIRRRFGDAVAEIVSHCSDTLAREKPPWEERKRAYLAHLEHVPSAALRVSLADKLHNASSVLADYRDIGDELWERFNEGGEGQLWYYGRLAAVFAQRTDSSMVDRLRRVVDELRREAGADLPTDPTEPRR